MEDEIAKLPEKERGFIQERFVGRKIEIKKLLSLLKADKIKDMSKISRRLIQKILEI